jgi:hypothetical protein
MESFRPAQAKKFARPYLNGKKAGHGDTCLSFQLTIGIK